MTRPLGAKRTPDGEERGNPIGMLLGDERVPLEEHVDLRGHVALLFNQQYQDCVGRAFGQAIRVCASVQGVALDTADLAIYAGARELEHPMLSKLPDNGAYPSLALDWTQHRGVVARDRWPDGSDPTRRLSEDTLEAGAIAADVQGYDILSSGDERRVDIETALAGSHPVTFAMSVDESYEGYSSGVWPGMSGPSKGGHCQCIVGCNANGVIVANSWGRSWGLNGFSIISWGWIVSDACHDFIVITLVPTEVA